MRNPLSAQILFSTNLCWCQFGNNVIIFIHNLIDELMCVLIFDHFISDRVKEHLFFRLKDSHRQITLQASNITYYMQLLFHTSDTISITLIATIMITIRNRGMRKTYTNLSHLLRCYSNLSIHFYVFVQSSLRHFHVISMSYSCCFQVNFTLFSCYHCSTKAWKQIITAKEWIS